MKGWIKKKKTSKRKRYKSSNKSNLFVNKQEAVSSLYSGHIWLCGA